MPLLSAGATLVVGALALMANPKRRVNQSFLMLTILVALWQFSIFMGMSSARDEVVMFWIHQASGFSAVIPSFVYLTRTTILNPTVSFWRLFRMCKAWLASAAAVFVLSQTSWFLKGFTPKGPGDNLPVPHYGGGFYVFCAYLLFTFFALVFQLTRDNRRLRGSGKTEIEYILLSCGTSFFIAVFFLLASVLQRWNELASFLPVSGIAFSSITGYGIATKGILDVPVLARRIIAYTILVLYLVCLYFLVLFVARRFLVWLGQPPEPWAYLLATFAVVFSVSPAHGLSQRLANRLFINTPPLDVGKTLREAGRALNRMMTTDDLCHRFSGLVHSSIEATNLRIFWLEDDHFVKIYPAYQPRSLAADSPLPRSLEGNSQLLVRELMIRRKATPLSADIHREMSELDAAAVIGIHRDRRLTGLLLLGPRASGRIYGQEEAAAVEGLRDLFAVAYENARLYTELRNSRIYMDLLLKNLVSGVLATDTEGRIITCNQEAARILDLDPVSLEGHAITRLPPPLHALLREAFAEQRILRDREITLLGEKEGGKHLNAGAALFRDHEGEVVGGLLVFQDRTALKELEEQVRRSERLASLGTLSAGMAHEIKNPLVTLKTFAQLLPERFQDAEFRETFASLAEKEIGRIDSLVNQLLSFARPVKPKLEPLSLHQALRTNVKWFRQQAEAGDIKVFEDYQAASDGILGDADQLQQVFLNLLLNAQEAMESGGEIRVTTRDVPGGVVLRIADTGAGISPEDLEHVFDPFFTTKSSGTGLGLAVAHQILKEHRAEVRVQSEAGVGSVFELTFATASEEVATA